MVGLPIVALGVAARDRPAGRLSLLGPDRDRRRRDVRQNPNRDAAGRDRAPVGRPALRRPIRAQPEHAGAERRNLSQLLRSSSCTTTRPTIPHGALERLSNDIKVDIVTVPILDPNTGRERDVVTAFTVGYDNRDPQRAHAGAEWLAKSFLEENRNDRRS